MAHPTPEERADRILQAVMAAWVWGKELPRDLLVQEFSEAEAMARADAQKEFRAQLDSVLEKLIKVNQRVHEFTAIYKAEVTKCVLDGWNAAMDFAMEYLDGQGYVAQEFAEQLKVFKQETKNG